ncbi:MAG: SH3 domain-containing protein [Roseomonas mucosa]|nr:SH3 domain-containing protein [Roseomonas mucosa]
MKRLLGLAGLVIIAAVGSQMTRNNAPAEFGSDSLAYIRKNGCMSGAEYNDRTRDMVRSINWSQVPGSATWPDSAKTLIGGVKLFDEMRRIGTPPCPDLKPTFDAYVRAQASTPSTITAATTTSSAPSGSDLTIRVQLKTGGNIRREPSTSGAIIRAGRQGESFRQFDSRAGWIQVGSEVPEGWIASSLLTRLPD